MKQAITPTYTFTPSAKTINLSGISSFTIDKLFAIINVTASQIIYAPGKSGLGYTALSGTLITLAYNTTAMGSSDNLMILYDTVNSTEIIDGSGNIIGSTSNALDTNIKSFSATSLPALSKSSAHIGNVSLHGSGSQAEFGSVITANRKNQFEIHFYNNDYLQASNITTSGGSSVSTSLGSGLISSGTATTSSISLQSKSTIKYSVGHEIYAQSTLQFTTPTSSASVQRWGKYNSTDGFYIGYNGTSFGVGLRKNSSDTFTAQASFSVDPLTGGTNSLFTRNGTPEALDTTKMNLFRIRYGWLGAGTINFEILNPDGIWVLFHQILYPNSSSGVSIQTPNLPVTYEVTKTSSDSTNLVLSTGATSAGTSQTENSPIFDFSNANLASAATYTTQWFDSFAQGGSMMVSVAGDQPINYQIQYSPDQSIIKTTDTWTVPTNKSYSAPYLAEARYFRVVFTNNGASTTTSLFLSVVQDNFNQHYAHRLQDTVGNDLAFTTKNVQAPVILPTVDIINTGRNISNLFMASQVITTNTDTLVSLTGYKSGAAVTATTTPAVVTTGKTYRITSLTVQYIAVSTTGTVKFTLRANTGGVVAITSPIVAQWSVGEFSASGTPAGTSNTVSIPIPEGMEFAAGTGIGISMQGFGATGTASAVGYGLCTIYGYEY